MGRQANERDREGKEEVVMVKIRKTFFAAWTIVLAFTAISIVQPSAYALEYPMVSQMLLIDPAASDLTSALTVTADQDPAAPVIATHQFLIRRASCPLPH